MRKRMIRSSRNWHQIMSLPSPHLIKRNTGRERDGEAIFFKDQRRKRKSNSNDERRAARECVREIWNAMRSRTTVLDLNLATTPRLRSCSLGHCEFGSTFTLQKIHCAVFEDLKSMTAHINNFALSSHAQRIINATPLSSLPFLLLSSFFILLCSPHSLGNGSQVMLSS